MGKLSKNPTATMAVRFAIQSLVALTAVALVACDSGDDGRASPVPQESGAASTVPLAQRFLTAADAPGTKPDPVEKRQITGGLRRVHLDAQRSRDRPRRRRDDQRSFARLASRERVQTARFYGKTHKPDRASRLQRISSSSTLKTGAKGALDWLEADSMKPCPMSCAAQWSNFDVDSIPDGACGVHRIATAEQAIETAGTADEAPLRQLSGWGSPKARSVYTVDVHGPPGSVSEEQASKIASAYYERLTGM